MPGFEGSAQRPPVAVDACMHARMQEEPSKALAQAGRSPLFLILAARHVRTIAHAIDGARYDLHRFGGGVPGESTRVSLAWADALGCAGWAGRTSEPHAACL